MRPPDSIPLPGDEDANGLPSPPETVPPGPLQQILSLLSNIQDMAPSLGLLRPIRLDPTTLAHQEFCGVACQGPHTGKVFPCASPQFPDRGPPTITLTFDTAQHLGRQARLEIQHGLHPYPSMETTTQVRVNEDPIARLTTQGCENLETTTTPSFPIREEVTTVVFEVTDVDAGSVKWSWFNLGPGSSDPGNLNPGVTLLIGGLLPTLTPTPP